MNKELFLETNNLTKKFGNVTAVNNVNMQIKLGEIRGLIGENGSGKSTISAIFSGQQKMTSGEMYIQGKKYVPQNPLDARDKKITMIVQESGTIDNLSIAENIFLGDESRFRSFTFIDRKKIIKEAEKALEIVELNVDVTQSINTLNYEERKLVEIARALYYNPSLFIVDETTTALSYDGRKLIHKIMRSLKEKNKAVLFISHDLPELMETCDSLTVLKDGDFITDISSIDFDEDKIKQAMVGREIKGNFYRTDFDGSFDEQVRLQARNVNSSTLKDINLDLHKGEILGIGGLSGSGIHELGRMLFGLDHPTNGEVIVFRENRSLKHDERRKVSALSQQKEGIKEIPIRNVKTAIANKIGYVSKNRDQETLILDASVKENMVLSALDKIEKYGIVNPKSEKEFTRKQMENLNIKCSSMNQSVRELSGGNKQKISFGKWIGNNSKILILDSPTRGVDVGVKATMYQLLYRLKKSGFSILIITEELQELIGMSDRILIMKDGTIAKELNRSEEVDESLLIKYMI